MAVTAARLMVEVGADTRAAVAGLKAFSGNLNNTAKSMTSIGSKMTLGITTPLVGIGVSAVNLAADFEQSMNVLQQVSGATESQLADLQAQALQLGADTVFSAGEAATGMLELAKAGMSTNDVMAAIPGVMALAAAAGTDLGAAAGITATALNAFGLEASESARVADLLAAGANASSADITDLAAGLQQAGFAFSLANQPIESLVASLALLTNVGLTGSDAGTALKNAFMRMMNPTNEALELMRELNISFYDAQGNMMQLPAIIDMLNASLAGLTPQQRDAALSTIFMSDGMKAMIPLLDAGSAGFNAMVGEVTQVGAATETANARMGGLRGGIETLKGAVESFMIGAALPFLDALAGLARGAADAITRFGALPQPIINTTLAIAGIAAAAGPVILVLGTLAGAVAAIGAPAAAAVVAIAALGAAWATNMGGIQQSIAPVIATVDTFIHYLSRVAESGQAFNSTLMLLPRGLAGFALDAGKALVAAQEFGQNLLNLGSYIGEVVAKGNALNIWLFTMSPAFADFALGVGNALVALQNFASGVSTAFSNTSFPSFDELFAQFQAGDFQRVATAISDAALDLVVNLNTELNISGQAEQLRTSIMEGLRGAMAGLGNIDWGALAISTAGLVDQVSAAISNINWTGVGANMGTALVNAVQAGVGAVGWAATFLFGLGQDLAVALSSWQWAELDAAFVGLSVAIRQAIYDMTAGMASTLGPAFASVNASFATYMQTLGESIRTGIANTPISMDWGKMGEPIEWASIIPPVDWDAFLDPVNWAAIIETINWGDWISALQWTGYVATLGWADFVTSIEWSSFVPSIAWSSFVTSLSWSSFVPNINWGSFIPDFSWGSFVPSLDWSRFIPWLNLGGGSGEAAPSTSGGGGGGGFGGGGGARTVVGVNGITVNVAQMNSPMDVHSAAIALAREFNRRVR